ncbi:MAG: DUF1565 domain-containing protein [Synechococcus sp.]
MKRSCGLGFGLIVATFGLSLSVPLGMLAEVRAQVPINSSGPQQILRTIHVNGATGSDRGDGSSEAPLKTLTLALQQATPGTVVQLAPGTYNAASGEVFPLTISPGVILRGDESRYGEGYLIVGGGNFISPTMARQSIAILAKDSSQVRGVTVRNEGRRGYAVWVESAAPTIEHNTFTGNVHDGVFVAGQSAPKIIDNRFYRNGANGISVLGTSTPTIADNLIQETGYGIAVSKNSRPLIVNNRISRNRSGLVITDDAQPILRNNVITENLEDGVVAISNSQPNLGIAGDPGGNLFEGNGSLNIHNATKGNVIQAQGNQLNDVSKIKGEVAFSSTDLPAGNTAAVPGLIDAYALSEPPTASQSNVPTAGGPSLGVPSSNALTSIAPQPSNVSQQKSDAAPSQSSLGGTSSAASSVAETTTTNDGFHSVPFSGSPPQAAPTNFSTTAVTPQSMGGGLSGNAPAPILNTDDVVAAASQSTRYRVTIAPKTGDTIEAVRSVAPSAIPAQSAGREVYIVGHYSTRSEAQSILNQLAEKGYFATAEVVEGALDS